MHVVQMYFPRNPSRITHAHATPQTTSAGKGGAGVRRSVSFVEMIVLGPNKLKIVLICSVAMETD